MSKHTAKAIATLGAAGICGYLEYITHGYSGIGWFLFALYVIWC
jgi:hypothetical protein